MTFWLGAAWAWGGVGTGLRGLVAARFLAGAGAVFEAGLFFFGLRGGAGVGAGIGGWKGAEAGVLRGVESVEGDPFLGVDFFGFIGEEGRSRGGLPSSTAGCKGLVDGGKERCEGRVMG